MAEIPDRDICTEETMNNDIIPFLKESVELELKTVVHCSAGMGRTGHVLAAWRYCHHDVEYKEAMASNNWECEDGRNPREAEGKPSDHLRRKVKESDYRNLLKSAKSGYDFL
jgi:protein-tyrosine phosphatase